ncbi:ATP synthase membrane subunit K, mitochondrial [Malaya genurostris]|uniref:ATP synthase membrane subunit K, mitochondrial n=1 Tax=Malaya genurostris TaxID=325434 RepID=UPI0026F3FE49|nr:ATP synthase membrane subunit K, mitochondrial [Malaya genurostris]
MAGGDHVDDAHLKGLSKIFNSETARGRANVAKATYAGIGLLILYFTLKPSKK